MDCEKLPGENDAIIMGTGMTESIIAAALSRIDLNVLSIDRNEYYGGSWGSFNLKNFKEVVIVHKDVQDVDIFPNDLSSDERFISLKNPKSYITNINEYPKGSDCTIMEGLEKFSSLKVTTDSNEASECNENNCIKEDVESDKPEINYHTLHEEMMKKQRSFILDLLPKMMFSCGAIIELLISSDVARYCEFKLVSRILTEFDGKLVTVPGSRSEVFKTTQVSVIEKRMLMKFLTFAREFEKHEDQYKEHKSKTFSEFLKEWKLSPLLQHYIQHAIAMVTQNASILEGLEATRKYLQSHGRYGNASLLSPLYGTGELIQCFCRLSSIFGGVYCLGRSISGIIVRADKYLSRAILITDKSVSPDKENHISLANIPSTVHPDRHIIMQELPPSSRACPLNFYVVHLTTQGDQAEADLSSFVDKHFHKPECSHYEMSESKPNIMWMVYFNIESHDQCEAPFENLLFVPGPDHRLDCDSAVSMAEKIFKNICPDKEFLPKAPSPEEIIYHNPSEGDGGDAADEGIEAMEGSKPTEAAEANQE